MFNVSKRIPAGTATPLTRRNLLMTLAAGAAVVASPGVFAAKLPSVEVFKDPNCGCCAAWVSHMEGAGFTVKVTETSDLSATRKRLGMPDKFASCHTAVVAGYLLEGHVPAEEVKRLLTSKPSALGLSVPGMPVGSPGMEMGARRDPFNVLLISKTGTDAVFASYPKL